MPAAHQRVLQRLSLEQILNRHPLRVDPEMTVASVVEQMNQADRTVSQLGEDSFYVSRLESKKQVTYALIVANDQLLGMFTESDLTRLVAEGLDLDAVLISAVMTQPVITLTYAEARSILTVLTTLKRHQIQQLPIVDEAGIMVGIVTRSSLLQNLDPIEMLEAIEQLQQQSDIQTVKLNEADYQLDQLNQTLHAEVAQCQRLELALHHAHQMLEERVGIQAAQLVQADEALREEAQERQRAQAQLERFFSVVPSPLCIAGFDGYFKRFNPSFAHMLGYDIAELLSGPFITFVHPDDRALTRAEIKCLIAGRDVIAFENRIRCKDGSYRWLSWNATAVLDEKIIYAAARDVTERQQFEYVLKRERDFISAVLDTVGALVIVLDQSGHVVSFNNACEHVSGYAAYEIEGRLIWDILIPPDERADVRSIFQQLKYEHVPNHHENHWIDTDGKRRLISWSNTVLKDSSGVVEYVIGTGIDITNQRQVEQNLARQYQQGQLLGEITRKIRDSLKVDEVLQTAVNEARELLDCDRVVIIKCKSDGIGDGAGDTVSAGTGSVIQESIRREGASLSLLNQVVSGLKLTPNTQVNPSQACACTDLKSIPCSLYTSQFLAQCDVRSCIEVAIHRGNQFWGIIIASQRDRPRQWDAFEIDLMQQLADQIGVAISHAQLLDNLEATVEQRTDQLVQINQQLEQEIQDRIQTENALRESQQKLAGILDNADDAIISINSQQKIVLYNQGAEQIFGYTPAEVLGQPLDILLPTAFHQIHQQHIRHFATLSDSARQMAERSRDVFGRRKTGEAFPAEASISKLQTETGLLFTVILKDITERRKAEAALRRSEEQLRLTTDSLPALICYVDPEQRYCFNNQTYETWFQRPCAALKGRYIWEVVGHEYYTHVQPHIETVLSGQRVSFESELTTPDGQSRCLLVTYIPEVDDDGKIKGFFGLTNDISDRKATERLKDEFVSVVGHELRTPLTSIHGSLKLLATKRLGTLDPKGQEIVEIALKNTERLTRLINDVLDLERIESGRITMALQACSVADLMMQAAQAMKSMADHHGVQLSVEPLDIKVWVDPDHMTQALTNLLSNAIKFSSMDSTVWLMAVERETDVMIHVRDQGRGVPTDKLETIFERFQQVDASDSRKRGGTGLGLAICKQIVQQHGGKIWAESTIGSGSSFFFTLPKKNAS